MEEFKPQVPNRISRRASVTLMKKAKTSLRTYWGIWLSAGVIVAIVATLCVVLIPQPGRVASSTGVTGRGSIPGWSEPAHSNLDSNSSLPSSGPSEPTISGFSPESSRLHFSSPESPPTTSEGGLPPAHSPSSRDLEGTYSATSSGVTITLSIYDADSDTAYAILSSTNAGTASCAAAFLGDTLLLVFPDSSELRLRVNGRNSLTFINSGTTLRRR